MNKLGDVGFSAKNLVLYIFVILVIGLFAWIVVGVVRGILQR